MRGPTALRVRRIRPKRSLATDEGIARRQPPLIGLSTGTSSAAASAVQEALGPVELGELEGEVVSAEGALKGAPSNAMPPKPERRADMPERAPSPADADPKEVLSPTPPAEEGVKAEPVVSSASQRFSSEFNLLDCELVEEPDFGTTSSAAESSSEGRRQLGRGGTPRERLQPDRPRSRKQLQRLACPAAAKLAAERR